MIFMPTISKAEGLDDVINLGDKFLSLGENPDAEEINGVNYTGPEIDETEIAKTASTMFHTLMNIGIVLSVIVGGVLGIQFMMASAEDKAKIKETLIPYVIGCVVIYGAYGIWRLVANLLTGI